MSYFILAVFIYLLIGYGIIYYFIDKDYKGDASKYIVIWSFGPIIWPYILIKNLFH